MALKQATAAIPIVILGVGNPIGTGLVQSLAHPGGNVTGTATAIEEWTSKRLQMITEILPGIRCLVYLRNPANPYLVAIAPAIEEVREKLQIEFQVLDAATPEQLDKALAAPIDNHCKSALFLALDGLFVARRTQIVEFAQRNKIALFGGWREDAEAGALMAFGFDQLERFRVGASYIDKILKGSKPADLPVQQPIKFTLIVNLKTAKGLGITVPQSILV